MSVECAFCRVAGSLCRLLNIADWLPGSPRELSDGIASFDEFAWRLLAAQMPLSRVTLHTATLHAE
jgi:hypothetical protein